MKVAFIYFNDYDEQRSPGDHLDQWFSITEWAEALIRAGIEIHIFLRYHRDELFVMHKARYYFLKDFLPSILKHYHLPLQYTRKIRQHLTAIRPDLIHAHNLNSSLANLVLRFLIPSSLPMLIQDHGALLPACHYQRIQTYLFKRIDGLVFAAPGQEKPWLAAGIISRSEQCFFVMEHSSPFSYRPRLEARRETVMYGEPVFLWVGNLDENKDPLTVLHAFTALSDFLPRSRLYMIYRQSALEKGVLELIGQHPFLQRSVALLGSKRRAEMAAYYNSADYFLSGSHKEGSGYALIEALSCGVVPIVTDIPSFGELTGQGEVGGLWQAGDSKALTEKIKAVTGRPLLEERERVLAHFTAHFSFGQLAKKMIAVYSHIFTGSASK